MFLKLVLLVCVVSIATADLTLEEQWQQFKKNHSRNFDTEEDAKRFLIFKKTVEEVEAHNKDYESGKVTYQLGLNQFADRTPEELKHNHGYKRPLAGTAGVV